MNKFYVKFFIYYILALATMAVMAVFIPQVSGTPSSFVPQFAAAMGAAQTHPELVQSQPRSSFICTLIVVAFSVARMAGLLFFGISIFSTVDPAQIPMGVIIAGALFGALLSYLMIYFGIRMGLKKRRKKREQDIEDVFR